MESLNVNNQVDVSSLGLSEEELFSHVDSSTAELEKITAPRYSYWKSVFRVFFKKKINIVILALLAFVIIFAYIYPKITNFDPEVNPFINVNDPEAKHLKPLAAISKFGFNISWILGTNGSGGSTFDTVWYGASISISLAFICAAINMTIGVVVGAVWGFSKTIDKIMMEVFNVIGNIPYILLISVLVLVFKPAFWTMVFALTVTGWIGIAYFIRTQVIIIRDREYNLASRCLGTNIFKITIKNILPFMTSVIVTLLATEIPSYISYEVYLSYLGMGISDTSLGKIIQMSEVAMETPGWGWEFWSPVFIAAIITIVLYVVGQNIGDASDPRTHM